MTKSVFGQWGSPAGTESDQPSFGCPGVASGAVRA